MSPECAFERKSGGVSPPPKSVSDIEKNLSAPESEMSPPIISILYWRATAASQRAKSSSQDAETSPEITAAITALWGTPPIEAMSLMLRFSSFAPASAAVQESSKWRP